jgi:hypothetical protein
MRISQAAFVAPLPRTAEVLPPPAYRRVPPDTDLPKRGDREGMVRYFEVKIARFFRRAFNCLPEEYSAGRFRRRNGYRSHALSTFPKVLSINPAIALSGLRQLTTPRLSYFWESPSYIRTLVIRNIYPCLYNFLLEATLTPAMASDVEQTLHALERMHGHRLGYHADLWAAFNQADRGANMLHGQANWKRRTASPK